MKQEDFKALKAGDKVIVTVDHPGLPEVGTILHRRPNWLDDGFTNCFEYDEDGVADFAFFGFDEVEKVSE